MGKYGNSDFLDECPCSYDSQIWQVIHFVNAADIFSMSMLHMPSSHCAGIVSVPIVCRL